MMQLVQERACYGCGNNKTYEGKNGIPQWYVNHDESNNRLCNLCYSNYIRYPSIPKSKAAEWKRNHRLKTKNKKLNFLGRRITFDKVIRTGVCSMCNRTIESGEIKQTQLHHQEYNYDDPLANTVELCVPCHVKESFRLGQSKGRRKKIVGEAI